MTQKNEVKILKLNQQPFMFFCLFLNMPFIVGFLAALQPAEDFFWGS